MTIDDIIEIIEDYFFVATSEREIRRYFATEPIHRMIEDVLRERVLPRGIDEYKLMKALKRMRDMYRRY